MPYFISQGCGGKPDYWGVYAVDTDTTYGCHSTKQAAIDQAVAISLADDEEFIGERAMEYAQRIVSQLEDARASDIKDNNSMDIRATAEELKPGVLVQWIQEDEIEYGAVITVDGDMAQVTPWEEEDGEWSAEAEVQLVEIGRLQVIPALPAPEAEQEDKPVETESAVAKLLKAKLQAKQ